MTAAAVHVLAAQGESATTELPAEPWVFGVGAFVALMILLLVTLSFGKDR